MNIYGAWKDVRKFHVTFGQPAPSGPTLQETHLVKRRARWIDSEVDELLKAGTIEEQADAYLDIIYFALGGFVELGINPEPIWDLVQAANMAKLHDGKVVQDANGKVIKPDDWVAPDAAIAKVIADQAKYGSNWV